MAKAVDLTVTGIGAQGDGLANYQGEMVYLPGTLPGDRVAAHIGEKGKFGFAVSGYKLLEKGDGHQAAPCSHYDACGGCSLQHLATAQYQQWLEGRLLDPLSRVGIVPETLLDPIVTAPASRRRVTVKLRRDGKRLTLGFAKYKSHQIIDVSECPVTHPDLVRLFAPLKDVVGKSLQDRKQLEISLTKASNGVDILIKGQGSGGGAPSLDQRFDLTDFANAHDVAAIHWSDGVSLDPVIIAREPVMGFGPVRVSLPPACFIQATETGEKALQATVIGGDVRDKSVADLFSGLGTFSFPLATAGARVTAIEGSKAPLKALKEASNRQQLNINTQHRDLFRQPLQTAELAAFDRVVIDPPRAGAKEQMAQIAASTVGEVVSISCNPATFARDAKVLVDGGYRLKTLQAVDQFLWSPHLEVAALFEKQ